MPKDPLSPATSLDEVKLRIRETYSNPNVGNVEQVWLKEGPRVYKVATLLQILDPALGEPHHYSLKIDTINKTEKKGWFSKPEQSVRIDGKPGEDELGRLYQFLVAHCQGKLQGKTGDLRIISSGQYLELEKLLELLPSLASIDQLNIVKVILSQLDGRTSDVQEFLSAFQSSDTTTLRHIAVASRVVEYKKAYEVMKASVDNESVTEKTIQDHLKANPWMFGSEYSELLDRRRWTRDNQLDFMLRRTVDGYLEIVEIKTPSRDPLLVHDPSHDSYYPSARLSRVVGQVMRYVEEVERDRDKIIAKDNRDTLKIRALVIIGRDGDKTQVSALRDLNSHLHGIEIITFDQLLRIADRVLTVFEGEVAPQSVSPGSPEGHLPF